MDTLTHHPFHYKANPRKMEESAAQKKRPRHAPGRKSFAFVIVILPQNRPKVKSGSFFRAGVRNIRGDFHAGFNARFSSRRATDALRAFRPRGASAHRRAGCMSPATTVRRCWSCFAAGQKASLRACSTAPPSIWRRHSFQTAPTQGFCVKRSENSLRRAFLKPRGAGI